MHIEIFDQMNRCTDVEVQRMLPLVSAQRREQALRYKHTLGQFCCLKSWLMVQNQVKTTIKPGNNPDKYFWKYNDHGKPYIEGGPYFSISHCKAGIAVVVSDEEAGIDIEQIRQADEDLLERVMSAKEIQMIAEAEDPDRMFTRLWTQKEAVVKAEGTGILSFEQLQNLLPSTAWHIETVETENYIYSIAYKN